MKTLPNFPEYSICKSGRVFSHRSNRYLTNSGEVLEFNSLNEAGRYFGKSPATFHKALKKSGKFKQYQVENIGYGRS